MTRSANPEATLAVATLTTLIVAVVGIWGAAELAHVIGQGVAPPANPFALPFVMATGRYRWPTAATVLAVLEGVLLLAAIGTVTVRLVHRRASVSHIDRHAGHLACNRTGLRRYTDPAAAPVAREIGPGVQIGRVIR